jgi:heterodisulfide reductase subunit C2
MKNSIRIDKDSLKFKEEILNTPGGEHLLKCFACGTCTASCPVHDVDETYNPRRIIRMILLGMKEEVLKSDFVWLCSTCYTCSERCPQGVQLASIMRVLKNIAVREGIVHSSFKMQADTIREYGKLYEIEDFDNKKRKRLDLPELEKKNEDMEKIFSMTGLKDVK